MNYVEVTVEFERTHPWRDVLISQLDQIGYESFAETKTALLSYIPENAFDQDKLSYIEEIDDVVSVTTKIIEDQNWNAKWEENFDPVLVEDKLVIKAPFHKEEFQVKMEVIIQPQMSFGTGHHQTTWLISRFLFDQDLKGKKVLDMGTGTGVLSVIAEKKGAEFIYAPDIDEWSFNNAKENVILNECSKIQVALGGAELLKNKSFDFVIANINKNVLVEQFSVYSDCMPEGGKMVISGFFTTDTEDLTNEAQKHGFIFEQTISKEGWAMMVFNK